MGGLAYYIQRNSVLMWWERVETGECERENNESLADGHKFVPVLFCPLKYLDFVKNVN